MAASTISEAPPTPITPSTNGQSHVQVRANLADFTIVPANRAQRVQHSAACFVPWARGRSFEQFLADDEQESRAPWAKDHRLITWVLVRRDDLKGDIYAGCITYIRRGMIKSKGSSDIRDTYVYGIVSVVTPVKHLRELVCVLPLETTDANAYICTGNGYATHLLRLLHYHLAPSDRFPTFPETWGPPPPALLSPIASALPRATGSILWSDVGSTFYSKCTVGLKAPGWIVKDNQNTEIVWNILPPTTLSVPGQATSGKWEWIYKSDLSEIAEILSKFTRDKLEKADTSKRAVYAQDPKSEGTLGFVPIYGSHGKQPAYRDLTKPEPFGVRLKSNPNSFVLFAPYNQAIALRLLITYVHNLSPSDVPSLLEILDVVGTAAQRGTAWLWGLELDGEVTAAFKAAGEVDKRRGVKAGRRPEIMGHLLGVAWYGPEEEEDGELVDSQMWSWC